MNFLKPINTNNIINVFREYMKDKYSVDIEADDTLRNYTRMQMQIVQSNAKGNESIQDLNIQVLGHLRKIYLEKLTKPKPSIRDAEVFGNRRIMYNESLPMSSGPNTDVSKRHEVVNQQRQNEFQMKPQRPSQIESLPIEEPENIEDFLAKVKSFEKERLQTVAPTVVITNTPSSSIVPVQQRTIHVFTPSMNPGPGSFEISALSLKLLQSQFVMIISVKIMDQIIPMKLQSHIVLDDKIHAIYEPFASASVFKQTVDQVGKFTLQILEMDDPISYSLVAFS